MKIYVDSLGGFSSSNEFIRVVFEGTFSYGDSFSKYAEYDKDGKMLNCDSGTSMRNPLYYIEVAEVYKKMLEIEGATAKELYDKAFEINKEYKCKMNKVSKDIDFPTLNKESNLLKIKISELEKKLKRLRNLDRIEECKNEIKKLNDKVENISNKMKEIDYKHSKLYQEEREKIKQLSLN